MPEEQKLWVLALIVAHSVHAFSLSSNGVAGEERNCFFVGRLSITKSFSYTSNNQEDLLAVSGRMATNPLILGL